MSLQKHFKAERCALRHAIARCHNNKHSHFKNYGGRGIQVCDEWRDPLFGFPAFLIHIGPRPSANHSLDRIDNDKGYYPGNVRWADRATQQRNRRKRVWSVQDYGWGIGKAGDKNRPSPLIEYQGKLQTLCEWCEELGLKAATIRQRIDRGWPLGQVLDPRLYNPRGNVRSDQQ